MEPPQHGCYSGFTRFSRLAGIMFFMIVFTNTAAHAQVSSSSDFNQRKPTVFAGGHIGFSMPKAGSDIYDMVTRELMLKKSDFRAAVFGGDFGVPISSHFAVVAGFEYSSSKTKSESRGYTESNGDPIEQTTQLSQFPITVTARYYPVKTGEFVVSYAWIPTRLNPYIGGGGGALGYSFNQSGRFVDTSNMNIFSTKLKSDGWTPSVHISGGVDINLTPRIFVNGEARYSWASANLSNDFTGFDPIDLSGFRILGGINFRF
jgi:opacity protein-like surface antigen